MASSASLFAALSDRHVVEGHARRRRPPRRRSAWFEITATISASSSPRRQRQSRSSRQWSWRETRIAMRCRSPPPANLPVHLKPRVPPACGEGAPASPRAPASERHLEEELRAQEEAPAGGIRGVLVGGDDVGAPLEQKARDRGHDPRPVGAADQQARRCSAGCPPAQRGAPGGSAVSAGSATSAARLFRLGRGGPGGSCGDVPSTPFAPGLTS